MSRRVEISVAEKGFIVRAARGPLLHYSTASQEQAEHLAAMMQAGEVGLIQDSGKVEVLNMPPIEWAVASADEALSIARKLLEDGEVA